MFCTCVGLALQHISQVLDFNENSTDNGACWLLGLITESSKQNLKTVSTRFDMICLTETFIAMI